ncbi:hypothetical protein NOF04DRAFT_1313565 [Fusarium oxysporum II5]|nr:hypothetical protein NOF04DRAFT_1313565 [Fusarium oxysporum II5]
MLILLTLWLIGGNSMPGSHGKFLHRCCHNSTRYPLEHSVRFLCFTTALLYKEIRGVSHIGRVVRTLRLEYESGQIQGPICLALLSGLF